MTPPKLSIGSESLKTLTQLGSFGTLMVLIFYIAPAMANRIIDANAASIDKLTLNNEDQRKTAVAIIREEREMFKEQIALERADCETKFQRLFDRLNK